MSASAITMESTHYYLSLIGNFTFDLLYSDGPDPVIDVDLLKWLMWLFTPFIITFLLPFLVFLLLYLSALFLHVYRHRHHLQDAYARDFWNGARHTLATLWDAHGWLWHGYEVEGLENIPEADEGPALLVYYHGALPVDYYYLLAKCILHKQRLIQAVGDRFLFSLPGFKLMMEVFHVVPGTVQSCAQTLKEGHLLSIAPGGVYEAQFGDQTYRLMWGKRIGFAKVAIEAKTPIIPIFTVNIREAFRSLSIGRSLFKKLYDKTRLPIVPIYGGFPVKLRTVIGKPILYDPSLSPEELASKTAHAIEDLILKHQRIPGNIAYALMDRLYSKKSKVT